MSAPYFALHYCYLLSFFSRFTSLIFHPTLHFYFYLTQIFSFKTFTVPFLAILFSFTTQYSSLLKSILYDCYFVWYFLSLYFIESHFTHQVSEILAHISYSAAKIISFDCFASLMAAVIINDLKYCCFNSLLSTGLTRCINYYILSNHQGWSLFFIWKITFFSMINAAIDVDMLIWQFYESSWRYFFLNKKADYADNFVLVFLIFCKWKNLEIFEFYKLLQSVFLILYF